MLLPRLMLPLLFVLLLPFPVNAAAPELPPVPVPEAPALDVKSYVLMDFYSGRVIAQTHMSERAAPASLTKLMTLYIAFSALEEGRITLSDSVRIGERAWSTGGSRMFLPLDAEVPVEQLIRGIIVDSGNDAAVALANYIGGNLATFAQHMNMQAAGLGMSDTHFVNPTGLPAEDHYTTAADMARLARALIADFPDYYDFFSQRSFTFNDITQRNRNKLLWSDPSVDGLKTGHTEAAGYNLIASAVRDDDRMITVVMGAPGAHERVAYSEALLDYGFRFYVTRRLYPAGSPVARVRVWSGAPEQVALGLDQPLYVTVAEGRMERLEAVDRLPARTVAPVRLGEALGTLEVRLGDDVLAAEPLQALSAVQVGGWWTRLSDGVTLFIEDALASE